MGPLFSLKNQTAWITGGKRIGKKVAEVLAENGANLVISYKDSRQEAEDTFKKVKKLGIKALLLEVDVSDKISVENALEKIKKTFKKIDVLVLLASIFEQKEFASLNEDDFRKNFDVHVLGTFLPIKCCLNLMPKGSHIITISESETASTKYVRYVPYFVAKGAILYLTKALASEFGSKGIFINTVTPGPILKPEGMKNEDWLKIRKESIVDFPVDDDRAVEEFAKLVLYLSTTNSTGGVYPLDMGQM
ncbi:MAG: SDR family oxidoreductase [Nanoarchaeota archaeon]